MGTECRPTLVSMEHLLSLGESGACYHGDVEELMGWNFSQGWLWDSTVALRHWKQKGTARPLRVTTKASLWALAYWGFGPTIGLSPLLPHAVSPSSSEKK